METPVMGVPRVSLADIELNGCPIHKGDNVMVMLGSVNTDEADIPTPMSCVSTGRRTGTWPSAPECTVASVPIWPVKSSGLRPRVAPSYPRLCVGRGPCALIHGGNQVDRPLSDDVDRNRHLSRRQTAGAAHRSGCIHLSLWRSAPSKAAIRRPQLAQLGSPFGLTPDRITRIIFFTPERTPSATIRRDSLCSRAPRWPIQRTGDLS